MHKRLWPVLLFCIGSLFSFAQIQSPDQFLGYKVGTRFTPHWRIVEYFKYVAGAASSTVKLQQYGQTNEGRPLLVVYVSTAAHIANLESIRNNNLGLAQMASSGTVNNAPAIVWLSYNVHGNEASSSEASMLALYALVDPSNAQTRSWLQNTVVAIDPCLNPDGRDRYVNWFNSMVGNTYNPILNAREHNEPWPGGRVNHYYFDLNRDWAWQTQLETQQRLQLYNSWLPQIHVDFHEQGINNPYYFAPAAEPFHEVITPFQRSFQETIGRNHAKYFDANGWLYFTKEVFDLLYPSYGDTYPLYNGAIGMTYEQGGGPAGGLGALTTEGDTLTLADRATHHFTTSMSTVEIASANASRLLSEYQKYYQTAVSTGYGDYKSYVIKYSANAAERIQGLMDMLSRNKIQYSIAKSGSSRGFNYETGKDENFSIASNDIIVPALQPKSALVKVLFEPNPKLSDSATYDITAWSLPYVYGLKTYASKDRLATGGASAATAVNNTVADPYGYIIRWTGVQSVRLVAQLLQKGIKLRYSEKPFESGGQSFDRGSIIILKTSNQYQGDLWNTVRGLANAAKVQLTPVGSGFVDKGLDFGSASVHSLATPKVALLSGEGTSSNAVGEVWHYFDQVINYPVTLVNTTDFGRTDWSQFDVVIMPNGNYRFLNDKASAEQLQNWVSKGGKLIAMENAVAQLSKQEWSIRSKKADDSSDSKNPYGALRRYENRERDELPNVTPGSIYKVELDNTHPLAFGYSAIYYTLKQDDQLYEFIKEGGWNVGVIKKERQVAGFVGSRLQNRLQDGVVFGTQEIGRGTVVYLADDVLFRSFWENGKLLFSNAVFLVGQ
ncbi:MAG: zinc carboxypeptidase [Flaviaesturariibacter sp.]|nr:zinc carboxypeptidase [Flaviaesturariibacter sp.]